MWNHWLFPDGITKMNKTAWNNPSCWCNYTVILISGKNPTNCVMSSKLFSVQSKLQSYRWLAHSNMDVALITCRFIMWNWLMSYMIFLNWRIFFQDRLCSCYVIFWGYFTEELFFSIIFISWLCCFSLFFKLAYIHELSISTCFHIGRLAAARQHHYKPFVSFCVICLEIWNYSDCIINY